MSNSNLQSLLVPRKARAPKVDATKKIVYFELRIEQYPTLCKMFGCEVTHKTNVVGATILQYALDALQLYEHDFRGCRKILDGIDKAVAEEVEEEVAEEVEEEVAEEEAE